MTVHQKHLGTLEYNQSTNAKPRNSTWLHRRPMQSESLELSPSIGISCQASLDSDEQFGLRTNPSQHLMGIPICCHSGTLTCGYVRKVMRRNCPQINEDSLLDHLFLLDLGLLLCQGKSQFVNLQVTIALITSLNFQRREQNIKSCILRILQVM